MRDPDLERRLASLEGWKTYVDEWRRGIDDFKRLSNHRMLEGEDHPEVSPWMVFLVASLLALAVAMGVVFLASGGIR